VLAVLNGLSDLATIATAFVAVVFYCASQRRAHERRERLENYLRDARNSDRPQGRLGRRTPMRIAANLSMTMTDVWNAARNNPKIKTAPINRGGFAVGITFYYDD
jgi:hypothetical protein